VGKSLGGGNVVFIGVFAFYCGLVMVVCGESVVSCVANVVN
jgi:hypothetical protein